MIKLYHGSKRGDLSFLRKKTWVTENIETARTFGTYVYVIEVPETDVDWEYLSSEMCDWDTNDKGEWRGTLLKDITCSTLSNLNDLYELNCAPLRYLAETVGRS